MITTVDGLRHGQLVKSLAGRDINQYYLIVNTVGDKYLILTDGLHHPVVKPKTKNIKHVRITMLVNTEIEELISRGAVLSNSDIIQAIRRMKNELEEGDRFHG